MSRDKSTTKKNKLTAAAKARPAPRWVDIKAFGLKRARSRRVQVRIKRWRRDKLKI